MATNQNARLDEQMHFVQATGQALLTGAAGDGVYVSLKNYRKATVIIDITNAGAGVTGTTVTLKQATTVAGAGEKALAFARMLSNIDVALAQTMVETPVVASTFNSDATISKRLRYIIEVDSDMLDSANGFDCFRVDGTGAVASTGQAIYILWGARYSGLSAATD